jgi:hypothetical protein
MKARTIKEISGERIATIPVGTEFEVSRIGKFYSHCNVLPINTIYNHEYEIIDEPISFHSLKIGDEFSDPKDKTKIWCKIGERKYFTIDKFNYRSMRGSDNHRIATFNARRWMVLKTN